MNTVLHCVMHPVLGSLNVLCTAGLNNKLVDRSELAGGLQSQTLLPLESIQIFVVTVSQ